MKSFLKIYICAEEHESKTNSLHIETQPILRKPVEAENLPVWIFAKRCSKAIGGVIDNLSEGEREELRNDLRKYLSEQQEEIKRLKTKELPRSNPPLCDHKGPCPYYPCIMCGHFAKEWRKT